MLNSQADQTSPSIFNQGTVRRQEVLPSFHLIFEMRECFQCQIESAKQIHDVFSRSRCQYNYMVYM